MLLCCSPKLYWMPKKPTFMFTTCMNDRRGRNIVRVGVGSSARPRGVVVDIGWRDGGSSRASGADGPYLVDRADDAHPQRPPPPGVPVREAGMTGVPHLAAAVHLLGDLAGPHGIHASLADTANYRAVFARDAVMAGVAGLLLRDERVTAGLVRTLRHLRDLQGREGQVASNYELGDGAPRVSFGTLAPRLDAATWYLVGIALGARAGVLDAAEFEESARAVVRLLDALEYNGRH